MYIGNQPCKLDSWSHTAITCTAQGPLGTHDIAVVVSGRTAVATIAIETEAAGPVVVDAFCEGGCGMGGGDVLEVHGYLFATEVGTVTVTTVDQGGVVRGMMLALR